jgi:hypothetical protein
MRGGDGDDCDRNERRGSEKGDDAKRPAQLRVLASTGGGPDERVSVLARVAARHGRRARYDAVAVVSLVFPVLSWAVMVMVVPVGAGMVAVQSMCHW